MQAISPLTAAAHDLKTPLALISGLATVLLDTPEPLSARQREYIERILLSSDRMLRVVQSLVDAYRVDQSEFRLQLEPVNAKQLIEEVAHELYPYSQKMGQEIAITMRQRGAIVVANRLLLSEALFNLVDNAIRHSEGKRITIEGKGLHHQTRLSVVNKGVRLAAADLQNLEQRLGGAAQPLQAQAGTSGIGLYIVRQLIQAMGGKVGLERVRSGTGVYLDLHTSTQLQFI